MIHSTERAISTINALIETCKDGQDGFRAGAAGVRENPALTLLLRGYAQQRADLAAELQAEVRRLGGDPKRGGSVCGAIRRGWMTLKAAVTGGDVRAIRTQCEAADDGALTAYDEASRAELTRSQQEMVERQRTQIKTAPDVIRAIRAAGA